MRDRILVAFGAIGMAFMVWLAIVPPWGIRGLLEQAPRMANPMIRLFEQVIWVSNALKTATGNLTRMRFASWSFFGKVQLPPSLELALWRQTLTNLEPSQARLALQSCEAPGLGAH